VAGHGLHHAGARGARSGGHAAGLLRRADAGQQDRRVPGLGLHRHRPLHRRRADHRLHLRRLPHRGACAAPSWPCRRASARPPWPTA
jgi:hypothetical protein